MRFVIILSIVLAICVSGVQAATCSLDLPALTGDYGPGDTQSVDFDFGYAFSSIQSVAIHWSGTITAGVYNNAIKDGILMAYLYDGSSIARKAEIRTGASVFPQAQPFDTNTVMTSYFGYQGFGNILDGADRLSISTPSIIGPPENPAYGYPPYSVHVDSIQLLVDGTPVPEPSVLVGLFSGVVGCAAYRVRRQR